MTVAGAELHVDDEVTGHGHIGFSHVAADEILPLADGLEVLHARNGQHFTDNYFNPVTDAYFGVPPTPPLQHALLLRQPGPAEPPLRCARGACSEPARPLRGRLVLSLGTHASGRLSQSSLRHARRTLQTPVHLRIPNGACDDRTERGPRRCS